MPLSAHASSASLRRHFPDRLLGRLLVIAGLAIAGCGQELPGGAAGAPGPLERAYADAARDYAVPVVLLKAIGHVETNWFHDASRASIDGGLGLMHLRPGEGGTLERARRVTGLGADELQGSARANVLGAAAALRELYDESAHRDPTLRASSPADWWYAVEGYAGFADDALAGAYARQVMATILAGAERVLPDGQLIRLPPTPLDLTRWPDVGSRRLALGAADYADADWKAANPANYTQGRDNNPIQFVIVHTTQGSYASAISWFQDPSAHVSSHFIVPRSALTPPLTQLVHEADTAHHAGNWDYNLRSIGIEHEGFIADPAWATDNTYCVSAKLTRYACGKYAFPCDRSHVLGHVEVPGASHTDPGQYWNWQKYMAFVAGGCGASPGDGTLRGVVYAYPDTSARIQGATVSIPGGTTQVTGSDGSYSFILPAGTVTVSASATGYRTLQATRLVTAGQAAVANLGLTAPCSETGLFKGFVYAGSDPGAGHLGGATVTLETGESQETAASGSLAGYFELSVCAGTHTATASLAGYQDNSTTKTVPAGGEVWGSIQLAAGPPAWPPSVVILSPPDGARLALAQIELVGQVGNASGVADVHVVWGASSANVPLTNGQFSTPLTVAAGDTTIAVTARNTAGEGQATITVHFSTGVCGFVHESALDGGGETARLSGATVDLVPVDGCAALATATTRGDGSFCVDAAAGDYLLKARAPGYRSNVQLITVPDDRRESGVKIALLKGADLPPSVEIVSPELDAATGRFLVTSRVVSVRGSVEGMTPSAVTVGGLAAAISLDGTFSVDNVPVGEGESPIDVQATGRCGETATRRITAVRVGDVPEPPGGWCGCGSGSGAALALALPLAFPALGRRRRRSA